MLIRQSDEGGRNEKYRRKIKKAALGAGCLFLALGAFEMQSHAADAAFQVQSRALLVTRGDYEGTEYDLTPGPQNDR